MRRDGFTLIEMIIVVVMIGVIAVIGFPKIRRALDQTNVRSTRVFLSTAVATARAAALLVLVNSSELVTRMIAQGQRSAVAATDAARILDSLRAVACTARNAGSAVVWRGAVPVDSLNWSYTADPAATNHWRLVLSSKYQTRQSQWRRDSMAA